jgi:hypothetical protein
LRALYLKPSFTPVEERWKLIRKAAEDRLDSQGNLVKPGDWKAIAWQLERKYPSDFGRPEVQLNLAVQNNIAMNGNTGAFETIIVSDLEYLELREQEAYEHHPRQGPIVEVELVSEELSGHLTRKGANGLVISQSQADEREQRLSAIRSKYAQLLEQTPGEH